MCVSGALSSVNQQDAGMGVKEGVVVVKGWGTVQVLTPTQANRTRQGCCIAFLSLH